MTAQVTSCDVEVGSELPFGGEPRPRAKARPPRLGQNLLRELAPPPGGHSPRAPLHTTNSTNRCQFVTRLRTILTIEDIDLVASPTYAQPIW